MSVTASDLHGMSEEDFRALWDLVMAERDRRQVMANAPRELARLQSEVLVARDGVVKTPEKPDEAPVFVNPSTPVELYPKGWIVKNSKGQLVRSLVDNNSADPDEDSSKWEIMELVEENPLAPVDDATEWDGENHPYLEDDYVQYHDRVYQVIALHYSSPEKTPDTASELYKLVK